MLQKGWSSRKLGCTGNEVTCKISSRSPCHYNTDFQLAEFTRAACPHNFFCRLRGQLEVFWILVCLFAFPASALLLASEMASVTLEVKINNQSCKQRKRRGRSWGKEVTKEKHIGTSKVKQGRVTDRWVQAEVLTWEANHTLFSRIVHWERAQRDFSTYTSMARPVGDLFWIFYFGALAFSPHAHIIYPWLCIHVWERLSRGGLWQEKDMQQHWSIPVKQCWSVCCTRLCPLHKCGVGAVNRFTQT